MVLRPASLRLALSVQVAVSGTRLGYAGGNSP